MKHRKARSLWGTGKSTLTILLLFALALGCAKDESPVSPNDGGPTSGTVRLSWDPPTANADGSQPVTDLAGYRILHGPSASSLTNRVEAGPQTSLDLELPFGTYFVAVVAYDVWSNESEPSNVIQVDVAAPAE